MTGIPDILGMLLDQASGILDRQNVRYTVQMTSPPRGPRPDGPPRVVRQTLGSDGALHLVIAPTHVEHRF